MTDEQMVQFLMWISESDRLFIDQDANTRYPELMAKGPYGRGKSPAIRDMIAFAKAHYSFFVQWNATRYQTTTEGT